MSLRHIIITGLFLLSSGFQSHYASADETQYNIFYKGKKVGNHSSNLEALPDGQHRYREKTIAKFKHFFMTFNVSNELDVTFDDNGIKQFSGYETFDGEKDSISGQRFGSKFEVVMQEDDEPAKTLVIDADQFELWDITPPSLQYRIFDQKQVGDEVTYYDIDSGSIQGIKITALDKQADHLSVSYHYIGDKEFVEDNDEEVVISIGANGKVLAFSEDDDIQYKLID